MAGCTIKFTEEQELLMKLNEEEKTVIKLLERNFDDTSIILRQKRKLIELENEIRFLKRKYKNEVERSKELLEKSLKDGEIILKQKSMIRGMKKSDE